MAIRWRGLVPEGEEVVRWELGRVIVTDDAIKALAQIVRAACGDAETKVVICVDGEETGEPASARLLDAHGLSRVVVQTPEVRVQLDEATAQAVGRHVVCEAVYREWALQRHTRRRTWLERKHARWHVYQGFGVMALFAGIQAAVDPAQLLAIPLPWAIALLALGALIYFSPGRERRSAAIVVPAKRARRRSGRRSIRRSTST